MQVPAISNDYNYRNKTQSNRSINFRAVHKDNSGTIFSYKQEQLFQNIKDVFSQPAPRNSRITAEQYYKERGYDFVVGAKASPDEDTVVVYAHQDSTFSDDGHTINTANGNISKIGEYSDAKPFTLDDIEKPETRMRNAFFLIFGLIFLSPTISYFINKITPSESRPGIEVVDTAVRNDTAVRKTTVYELGDVIKKIKK